VDPDRARYLAAVEARYVTLRGRGYALSARDVVRVERWRERGVPLKVAERVLEDGVREFRRTWRLGEGAPRSLRYFERALDEAMAQRQARLVGAGDAAPEIAAAEAEEAASGRDPRYAALLAAVESAGQRLPDGAARQALRRAWQQLRGGRDRGEDLWTLTADVDRAIVAELQALVPPERRAALEAEAEAAVADVGGARMSAEARREHHRFELDARVRATFEVPELLEVLLEC